MVLAPFSSSAVRSVTLAWDPSVSTTVAGYHIYCGGASATYTNTVDAGNSTNATISGLNEGGTYFFTVTAYDSSGMESDFSNEINYTIPVTSNAPPTLDSLADVSINENSGFQTVDLSGISSGATNESQTLTVTA
ncbi:MAG: fibronectin type III domain-containing protein, partial [Verrucomicrobiota bacterium]